MVIKAAGTSFRVIMDNMKRKKSYSLPLLLIVILASLFFMGFSSRQPKTEEEEMPVVREEIIKPCDVKEHYKVYLGIGEVYVLDDIGYVSQDESVASVKTNRVTGHKAGKVKLVKDCNTYEVEVSEYITAPYIDDGKPSLPCGEYTVEENEYLDEILRTKIVERGYRSRAAAVQAARFLLLQFPYHLNYFNENGRLPYADGEGRYYHEGLYLNEYKVEEEGITRTVRGPKPWGCPIYSIPVNGYLKNSLDCSGFVSWCLINAGFDPGDIGAGPKPNVFDLSDLGEKVKITAESLDEIKVGDLLSSNGHIAMLIGYKDGIYYIGESNYNIDMRVKGVSKEEFLNDEFNCYIDMDEFYGYNDGKLNLYWQ